MPGSIAIRVPVEASEDGLSKGMFDSVGESQVTQIDLTLLKRNLDAMRKDVGELFEAEEKESGVGLQSIEVALEISAEGGVRLIGVVTAGIKAGITLKFERR